MFLSEKEIEHFFKMMTKNLDEKRQGLSPLNFQKKLIDAHLNGGKNVILHAPTGAGKTLAALSPFYISKYLAKEIDFPAQSIYVLPLRTLAHSLADEAKIISNLWEVKTQTGEVQEDPFFLEGDVVFTTIDQALSGALTIPLSLPPRLANINAGVWPGSYLIFDEFHLLDPNRSLQTTIHLLKQLCVEMQLTRFTIMTATLSREIREILAKELNAVHIEVTDEDLSQIKSQFQKKRKVITHSRCLSAHEIIEKHTSKTIVIVNQVDRATSLYKEVKRYQPKETEIFLLHSRLLSDERKSVERKLKEYFGKKRNKRSVILITTQVVEVGLDITSDVMLTELSSAPSFLQRIGRNARFEGEEGIVHVYTLDDSSGNQPWLPYDEDEVKATEVYLQNVCDSYFDFIKSNDMINQLCSNKDKEIWQKIKLHQKIFKEIMADAYRGHDKGLSGKLIRNIESVSILIHGKPPRDERIYLHETISMPIGKMKGFVNNLIKRGTEFKGKIQRIVYEGKNISFKNIESVIDIRNFDYIIIHPSLASYEENVGLFFGTSCKDITYSFPVKSDEKIIKRYIYKMDTFEEHINACLKAYKEVCYSRTAFTRKGFAELFKLTSEDINRIIDFIIVMHDAGKLSKDWQSKAMNIQQQVNSNFNEKILLAHTDSQNGKRMGFPDHSVLGAVIAYGLFNIDEKYSNLVQSVLTAIAHHHAAIVEKLVWEGPLKGLSTLHKLLSQIGWNIKTEDMKQHLTNQLKEAKYKKDWSNQWSYWHVDPRLYWMYLFLVRQLRISDQRSFDYVEIIRNDHTSYIVEEKKNDNSNIKDFLRGIKIVQLTAFYKAGINGVTLPSYQGSTFRGVFGHVFKNIACTCPISRNNEVLHHEHCPYVYIFETHLQNDVRTNSSSDDIPRPFIISTENSTKQHYAPGERFSINITLFGKSIDYIEYLLYVLFHMGAKGFGKGKQQSELRQIFLVDENGDLQEQIFKEQKIGYNRYILNSKKLISINENMTNLSIHFITPTRIKFQGKYTDNPEFHIILRSAVRRITSLLYYHHDQQQLDIDFNELFRKAEEVKLVQSDVTWYDWERYSNRQKDRMKLGGIIGNAVYEGDLEPFIPWLQLAEWTHIGKNTTFGLGKIKVVFQ